MTEDLEKKNVLVVGLAESGVAAARFLAKKGARVTVTDMKVADELGEMLNRIKDIGAELSLGGHPEALFENADLVVTSPGVPKDMPGIRKALAAGVPVVSELELAARHTSAPLMAITGTNGKTTTVELAGEIMSRALGRDQVFVGGNIGTPLMELPFSGRGVKAAVIEVSSFQLEFIKEFHPRVAVMLNITPDHLDRYADFNEYARTKWRIFDNQEPSDTAVINVDDPLVRHMARGMRARVMGVSLEKKPAHGMWFSGGSLLYLEDEEVSGEIPLSEILLHGAHNLVNVMAATCASMAMGAGIDHVRRALEDFEAPPHRLEYLGERRGVRYYNDSKATNPGAVEAAVRGLEGPLILLMGGRAKGLSFAEMAERLAGKVKLVAAFGEAAGRIKNEMGAKVPVEICPDLKSALEAARAGAEKGDAVILSPGCASFDQYGSYKERGDEFRRLVEDLF